MKAVTDLRDQAELIVKSSQEARRGLQHEEVVFFGPSVRTTVGGHFLNYARMIKNRTIDLFDDCMMLYERGRIPSACILSRCIIETHAMSVLFCDEIDRKLEHHGIANLQVEILKFINSSRIKKDEQKAFGRGEFNLDDYHFTPEARNRMENQLAQTIHVADAIRALGAKFSDGNPGPNIADMMYSGLCEWTHPSQTSLLHQYAKSTHQIQTSLGTVELLDSAKSQCAFGLSLIRNVQPMYLHMAEAARYLQSLEDEHIREAGG